jgi:hypothetical protein
MAVVLEQPQVDRSHHLQDCRSTWAVQISNDVGFLALGLQESLASPRKYSGQYTG